MRATGRLRLPVSHGRRGTRIMELSTVIPRAMTSGAPLLKSAPRVPALSQHCRITRNRVFRQHEIQLHKLEKGVLVEPKCSASHMGPLTLKWIWAHRQPRLQILSRTELWPPRGSSTRAKQLSLCAAKIARASKIPHTKSVLHSPDAAAHQQKNQKACTMTLDKLSMDASMSNFLNTDPALH